MAKVVTRANTPHTQQQANSYDSACASTITRRAFMGRCALIGAGIAVSSSVLGACGNSGSSVSRLQKIAALQYATSSKNGGWEYPNYVGEALGLFDKANLSFTNVVLSGGTGVADALATGEAQLGSSSPNEIAILIDKGQPIIGIANEIPIFEDLIVSTNIKTFADLRGTTLAVSGLAGGDYIWMQLMLKKAAGLRINQDYKVVAVGGTSQRVAAIEAGTVAGALVAAPGNFIVEKKGFHSLGYASDYVPLDFGGLYASTDWLKANAEAATEFLRVQRSALLWLADPTHTTKAVDIIVAATGMPTYAVVKMHNLLLRTRSYLPQTALKVNFHGVQVLFDGEPNIKFKMPESYYDLSYLNRVLAA